MIRVKERKKIKDKMRFVEREKKEDKKIKKIFIYYVFLLFKKIN